MDTLFIAINIMDRTMMNLFANTYRLHWVIASTSVLLAIKINEEIDPEISKMIEEIQIINEQNRKYANRDSNLNLNLNFNNGNESGHDQTGVASGSGNGNALGRMEELAKSQILAMERRITLLLNWHLNPPTPKTLCHALMDSFPCPFPFPFKYRIAQMVEHLFLDHVYMSPEYYNILESKRNEMLQSCSLPSSLHLDLCRGESSGVLQLIGEILVITLDLAAVKDHHWTLIVEKLLNCKLKSGSLSLESFSNHKNGANVGGNNCHRHCLYDRNAIIRDCMKILDEMEGIIQIVTG